MTRNRPTATLQPGKYGTWTVVKPNGNAVPADSIGEARRIANSAGAVLIRVEGPASAANLHRTGNA